MYPQPGQTGQWNPNPPPPSSSAQPQPGQQQWSPPPQGPQQHQPASSQPPQQSHGQQSQHQHPQHHQPPPHHQQGPPPQHHQPNGQYSQRPPSQYAHIPPITQGGPPQGPPMTTLQPQHPDAYRSLPAPHTMYGPPPGYPPQGPMHYQTQPAPRQRTAIACRYCRRRKIRCSGFDQSEDGRCTNCQRFSQECVFTPVSAQTQAFVPAHTVWRNQGAMPPQLYGAYGQPLPQGQIVREYAPHQQYSPAQNGQYQAPPQYGPPGQQPPHHHQSMAPPPQGSPAPGGTPTAGQKRPNDEPHTPTLPPPNPANNASLNHRSPAGDQSHGQQNQHGHYSYPDPSGAAPSPASSAASFHSAQPQNQPYYPGQQPHRPSPPQNYTYDQHNHSSPHVKSNSQPNTSDPALRPPKAESDGGSSPANGSRQGVKINELVGPSGQAKQEAQTQAS